MTPQRPVRALLPAPLAARLSRRAFLGGTLGAGASLALAACAPGTGGGGSEGGKLNVYTWGEYNDPAVLEGFSGATISIDSYGSNPEMIAKLAAAKGTSGYDICVPTHSVIAQMVEGDLLEELDHSLIPNMKNLSSFVMDTDFDPGNRYSVCKDWGSTGYVYDTTVVGRELTSWKDFWEVAQNEASGSFSLLEDQSEVAFAFMLANGYPMNPTTPEQVEEYRQFILTIAPHVQAFESYPSAVIGESGRVLAHCWNGDARQGLLANKEPGRYKFVWPEEGANIWQDNWAIVKGATNPEGAHEFINYILEPEVSLQDLAYIGYNTGVEGMEEAAEEAGVEMPELIFIDDDVFSKLTYSENTGFLEDFVTIMDELRAAAG